MTQTAEVIKIRIESLQHTRQFIAFLAGGLTGIYAIVGLFSSNLGTICGIDGQTSPPSLFSGWGFLVLALWLLVTLALANLCFVLSVFLLTDSAHNYSKILEYGQSDLFPGTASEATLAHHRALVSDDLSYFYLRVGVVFLVFNLLLAALTVVIAAIPGVPSYISSIIVVVCGLIAFFLVLHCYRVSHYRVPEYTFGQAIVRFWSPRRWRDATRKLQRN